MTEQQPAARDELVLLISSPNTGTGRVHALIVNPNRVPAKFFQHANRTGLKLDDPHANVAFSPPSPPSHIQLRPIQHDRSRTPEPREQNVKRRGLPRFLGNIPEVQMPAGKKKWNFLIQIRGEVVGCDVTPRNSSRLSQFRCLPM